jgi:hypothetical protein
MTSAKRAATNRRDRRGLAARAYIHASAIIVICAALGLSAAPAAAQQAAAEALFNQGRELMKQKKFAEACEKFQGSHELDPSVGALLNLGDCRKQNGQIATAWATFREAASLAHQLGDTKRKGIAEKYAKQLESSLPYLVIDVPEGARVNGMVLKRNDETVVSALWNEKVPVDPGTYVIRAEAPGYKPAELTVEVPARGGETRATVPALEPESTSEGPGGGSSSDTKVTDTAVTAETPADTTPLPTGRKIALGAGAVGVVGLTAGMILGLRASSLWNDAKAECVDGDLDNCTPRGVTLANRARSSANLATVSFTVGVAAAATGVVLWILNPPPADGAEQAARIEPVLGPDALGAQVTLRF